MMRSFTIFSLLTYACLTITMDNRNIINMSITSRYFLYIGPSNEREEVEKAYGCTFPMNTIFVPIKFRPNNQISNLDLIPYDYIHQKNEGDTMLLTINEKPYTICCKNLENELLWPDIKFEKVVKYRMTIFTRKVNWLTTFNKQYDATLIKEKVIHPGISPQHGENKSPFV